MSGTRTLEVIYHFDVWGNEEDGFEVNDSVRRPSIEVEEPIDKRKVWDALVAAGEAQGTFEEAVFREHGSGYDIDGPNGRPIWTINDCW